MKGFGDKNQPKKKKIGNEKKLSNNELLISKAFQFQAQGNKLEAAKYYAYLIENGLKDHRVFMTSVIAALTFGGNWHIHDKDSIKTSFPRFLEILKQIEQ